MDCHMEKWEEVRNWNLNSDARVARADESFSP